jgi:hypothetical protein
MLPRFCSAGMAASSSPQVSSDLIEIGLKLGDASELDL